jgi:ribonuclease-3
MAANLSEFQRKLGYFFKDLTLLKMALTHPSVAHEQGPGVNVPHNQRLEFLGDAVLQLALTRELYLKFPGYGEGPLTKARARLVNSQTLAEHGARLGIGAHLTLSRGEEISGGRERQSSLADAYEAIMGAVFLDSNYENARDLILREFADVFTGLRVLPTIHNPKGELQELLQEMTNEAPSYQLVGMAGPDHERVFECSVHHGGQELGRGSGKNKKEAESAAAIVALERLKEKLKEKTPAVP